VSWIIGLVEAEEASMPIPDYQAFMLPALKALANGREARISTIRKRIADTERLSHEDLGEMLPSGKQTAFVNRVSWAIMHLQRAVLVARVRRAVYQITEDGTALLARHPPRIDLGVLQTYPAFVEWAETVNKSSGNKDKPTPLPTSVDTPEEALDRAARQLRNTLQADVLDRVRKATPAFFEQVVVDLLIAMGYGGGDAGRGSVDGKSGDHGIDGTIREDALGLDEVYVQAKRYGLGNTVGEDALRSFAGAIDAAGTNKGVFVTSSRFTKAAQEYVKLSPKRIVLIDGDDLARRMVDYKVGVRVKEQFEIKRIDEDYFEQDSA
jgi:restriction system protein